MILFRAPVKTFKTSTRRKDYEAAKQYCISFRLIYKSLKSSHMIIIQIEIRQTFYRLYTATRDTSYSSESKETAAMDWINLMMQSK